MKFNEHWELQGKHAFIGASSYHWLNYTPQKMHDFYLTNQAKEKGTELHAIASSLINNGLKMAHLKKAFNMFVNDAIGFKLHSEQVLVYSAYAFGTADAIAFRDGVLRIHDLKTGVSTPSFKQLNIYAALFCLEYDVDPEKIDIVERLYQGAGFEEYVPTFEEIQATMDKIIEMDEVVAQTAKEYNNQDF